MAVPPLSKLLVPQAEAAEKITAQINSGRKIVFSLGHHPSLGLALTLTGLRPFGQKRRRRRSGQNSQSIY